MTILNNNDGYKIYALLIKNRSSTFLSVQYATSLEDAYVLAKIEFAEQNPEEAMKGIMEGATIVLFTHKVMADMVRENEKGTRIMENLNSPIGDIPEIFKEMIEQQSVSAIKLTGAEADELKKKLESFGIGKELFKKEETIVEKETTNDLMLKIIKNKDISLLEKNKKKFTKAEIKYISDKIR